MIIVAKMRSMKILRMERFLMRKMIDTEMGETTEQNTEPKLCKQNCFGEGAKKKFESSWNMINNKLNYNLLYYNNIIISFLFVLC